MSGSLAAGEDRPRPGRAAVRAAARAVLARTAHPVLLLAVVAVFAATVRRGWPPGPVTFAFQFATLCYLAGLERLIPYERSWRPSRREWRWYGVYYLLTTLGGSTGQTAVLLAAGAVAPERPLLPLAVEMPLALLLGSLASYAIHRLGHTNPWLWRLHGVHHVPDKVNVGNNGVNHVLDVFVSQACAQLRWRSSGSRSGRSSEWACSSSRRATSSTPTSPSGSVSSTTSSRDRSSTGCTTAPTWPRPGTTAPTCPSGTGRSAASPGARAGSRPRSASCGRSPSPPPARSAPPWCTRGACPRRQGETAG
ncbi:hypothetical protein GCM10020254_76590 [Streptomyces goshikiensis]